MPLRRNKKADEQRKAQAQVDRRDAVWAVINAAGLLADRALEALAILRFGEDGTDLRERAVADQHDLLLRLLDTAEAAGIADLGSLPAEFARLRIAADDALEAVRAAVAHKDWRGDPFEAAEAACGELARTREAVRGTVRDLLGDA